MDLDEQHRLLVLSLGGAHQLLAEVRKHGTAAEVDAAELGVRLAEEALAWFENDMGMAE